MSSLRTETVADHDAVRRVQREAFGREGEAALVDRLRRESVDPISLVAESDAGIVGHVLFSEARLEVGSNVFVIGALGPVGVLASERRHGIAAALIREGLQRCWARAWPAVIVLGNPAYYTRFGFSRADTWSIRCEFDVPPPAFMIAFAGAPIAGPGMAKYHSAFADV
jgi:putative acetyltransferase